MKPWPLVRMFLLCCAVGAAPAHATAAAAADSDGTADTVRRFVSDEIARTQPGLRTEITVGRIDSRMHLAPCARTEAFLRPGGRLWGRGFVGLRCLDNPGWSVSVPVNVRVFGRALVVAQPIPAMQPIAGSAVREDEVELSLEAGGVATDVGQVQDRYSTRALEPGQAIALAGLRSVPAIGQGDAVKLVGVGNGFQISTDGTALATVAAGELVRVRTESGHTLSGIARRGRIVEVSF